MQRRPSVLIWGAGMSASVHAGACHALDWPIVAVASRRPERAQELAAHLNESTPGTATTSGTVTARFEDVVERRVADLAIVATPPSRHVDDAITLLGAGYQVVVETPIGCTLDGADRLLEAERRVERPVLYSEHLASAPAVDGLFARLPDLGPLTHLSARSIQPSPTWRSEAPNDWGGGALFDLGVHPIGLVLRTAAIAGAGGPTGVTAVLNESWSDREHATVKIRFGDGPVATVNIGWNPGGTPDADLQVSSTSGVLRVDLYPTPSLEHNGEPIHVDGSSTAGTPSIVDDYGYTGQLRRFWATTRTGIRSGRPAPATSRFGRAVLEVVIAAYRSAGDGAVEVPLPYTGPRDQSPIEVWQQRDHD